MLIHYQEQEMYSVSGDWLSLVTWSEWLIFTQEFLGELKLLVSLEGQLETDLFAHFLEWPFPSFVILPLMYC